MDRKLRESIQKYIFSESPIYVEQFAQGSVSTTQNRFPGMNSEISWNLSQFPETEQGQSALVRCPRKFTICTSLMPFLK